MPQETYFEAIEQRIGRLCGGKPSIFYVRVAGRVIELRFTSSKLMETARRQLIRCVTEAAEEPDARFYFWNDEIEPYLPECEEVALGHQVRIHASGGYLRAWPNGYMVAANPHTHSYYYCESAKNLEDFYTYRHVLVRPFSLWAQDNDLILLHSAAVGLDGKGVLISARGGGGKSTLSISCLLSGLDFVSDDYVMLSGSGSVSARPIYSMVCLNPDMYKKFPQIKAPVLAVNHQRGDRLQLDASGYRFSDGLDIGAILFPVVTEDPEPSVHSTARGKAMVHLIDSTIHQMGEEHNTALVQKIAGRFTKMPVYQIRLCPDPMKNAEAVRRFIKEDLHHVSD